MQCLNEWYWKRSTACMHVWRMDVMAGTCVHVHCNTVVVAHQWLQSTGIHPVRSLPCFVFCCWRDGIWMGNRRRRDHLHERTKVMADVTHRCMGMGIILPRLFGLDFTPTTTTQPPTQIEPNDPRPARAFHCNNFLCMSFGKRAYPRYKLQYNLGGVKKTVQRRNDTHLV